ncbi:phage tail protein, partial [Vibrio sp. A14(2019)]
MSQTAIPLQFEKYLQNQISIGQGPDMNEMIFAYIPDLDPSQPIDRNQGLPDVSLWVYQQNIDQEGKLGENALVYSVVIPGSAPEFTFNAIYMRDKNVQNSCGMVVHKATETKESGAASTKSLMQQYTGAAQIAGITVDAATWQIDYQARLKGMDEDLRLACLDNYGHTAFVDGFDVTQQADPNKYKITPGVVYVGGLRAVLSGEVLQTITTKPNGIYIDVVRDGTALSAWENTLTIKVSTTQLNDYVDAAGRKHYVAKLAGINANGSVVDWRVKGGLEALKQPWSAFVNYAAGYQALVSDQRYVAVQPSGPNNGGAVNPSTDTDWSHWKPVWALNQVENRLKGNQNWNIPGRAGHPLPDATPRDYPSGAEIALGYFVGLGQEVINFAKDNEVLSADGGYYYVDLIADVNSFFGIKLPDNRVFKATIGPASTHGVGVAQRPDGVTARVSINFTKLIELGIPRGAHKFVGCSELPGVWPDVSDEESANAVSFNKEYASIPIGAEMAFDTPPPTDDPRFRFVKLTADDAYNGSLLNNKVISGTAPNLVVKMTVNSTLSPLNGQQIFMLNTMGAMPTPGLTYGVIIPDAMRNFTGAFIGSDKSNPSGATGVFSSSSQVSVQAGETFAQEAKKNRIDFDLS